jgi:hypothetical protein
LRENRQAGDDGICDDRLPILPYLNQQVSHVKVTRYAQKNDGPIIAALYEDLTGCHRRHSGLRTIRGGICCGGRLW